MKKVFLVVDEKKDQNIRISTTGQGLFLLLLLLVGRMGFLINENAKKVHIKERK
jgi:hypothetical protein